MQIKSRLNFGFEITNLAKKMEEMTYRLYKWNKKFKKRKILFTGTDGFFVTLSLMNIKKIVTIALAYIGVLVGAGFASGQEIMQYFISFGYQGIWGAIIAAVLFAITGLIILQLGSYYFADEHMEVLDRITQPWVAKLLDFSITFTCFCIGFVMIAGAGSNLQQQFGLPLWVGAVIMAALMIVVGMFDVEKVTNVIGAITPFMILFMVIASIYAITQTDFTQLEEIDQVARTYSSTLPNWWLSSLNYVAMSLMCAVSMAIVMGGVLVDVRVARYGGLIGGMTVGGLVLILVFALYFQAGSVRGADLPTLALVNKINPKLGTIMSIVVLGMIFNTRVSMYYALTARLTRKHPKYFKPALIVLVLVGFGLSFFGFKTLVGYLYPLIGYIGLVLIAVLLINYGRKHASHCWEMLRRIYVIDKVKQQVDPNTNFSQQDERELETMVERSKMDNETLLEEAKDEALIQLGEATHSDE